VDLYVCIAFASGDLKAEEFITGIVHKSAPALNLITLGFQ